MRTVPIVCLVLVACSGTEAQPSRMHGWPECDAVPHAFVDYTRRILSDSTDLFLGAYPAPPGLSCELLEGLRVRLMDDSARYHFEHFSRRFWSEDGRNTRGLRFIRRSMDFDLSIAATAHWNADVRIMALDEVMNYRRMRPMVCTTKDGYTALEEQDRRAVRYLVVVLANTPLYIPGSENSAIHAMYIDRILRALDLFTGTSFFPVEEGRIHSNYSEGAIRDAVAHWKKQAP